MFRNNKLFAIAVGLVVVTAIVSFTVATGVFYFMGGFGLNRQTLFDPSKVSAKSLQKFAKAKSLLESNYYESVDENKLLEGSISGMADSLNDPYTVYYSKEQMKMFDEMTEKSQDTYVGIGISVNLDQNGILTVIEPFEKSPAADAGIKPGDKIVAVDGKDVTSLHDENLIIEKIKGIEGTEVKIKLYRPSESNYVEFTVKRRKITVVINVKSEIMENNIGYIRLAMFDTDIYNNFKKEVDKLLAQNVKGLIVDLRNDPGGSYQEVVKICDMFLPKDLIVYTEDRNKKVEKEYSDENEIKLPLTLLVNENSASASEIFTGAMKDNHRATIIGTKTFGKGLVQTVIPFDDGSGLKLTIARYYTPSGVCIQGKGIMPDVEVKNDPKFLNVPISAIPKESDEQLKKAIENIKGQMK